MTDRAAMLGTLLANPARATQISREEAAALLVQLAALQAALAARLQVSPVLMEHVEERADSDRLLAVEAAAQALNMPVSWLYRRSKELPFARKFGGILRFSERGLRAWVAKQRP
jgi:predicted DNA-binding transcriptional regulator AlpA